MLILYQYQYSHDRQLCTYYHLVLSYIHTVGILRTNLLPTDVPAHEFLPRYHVLLVAQPRIALHQLNTHRFAFCHCDFEQLPFALSLLLCQLMTSLQCSCLYCQYHQQDLNFYLILLKQKRSHRCYHSEYRHLQEDLFHLELLLLRIQYLTEIDFDFDKIEQMN